MESLSDKFTVDDHFHGRSPVVREIYDALLKASCAFGPVSEQPKKTSIHLARKSAFAGIQTRREWLILTLKSREDIRSPRVMRREQASANRWHLEVKLTSPDEVDAELVGWLEKAYDLAG